jgi:hypothetical protein
VGRLALLFGSLFLAVLLAEVAVRLFLPRWGHNQLLVEDDELLGWRKIPNGIARIKTSEYEIIEEFNSKGLRGPDYPYEKGDAYRVLVLGDSFVEAYQVAREEMLTTLLEKRLRELTGKRVEVINAGTSGYSTDQELLFFTSEGKKYKPDVTVVMFYDNDLFYNAQPRYWRVNKPLFVFTDGGELELTNVPVSPSAPNDGEQERGTKAFLRDNSQLYIYVRDGLKRNLAVHRFLVDIGIMTAGDRHGEDGSYDTLDLVPAEFRAYSGRELPEGVVLAWKTTAALLGKLREETAATGSELLVFHIPPRFAVNAESGDAFARQYSGLLDPSRINRDLEQVCEQRGIDFSNPLQRLRDQTARQEQSLYFDVDSHWNPAGQAFVADLLAEEIVSRYMN